MREATREDERQMRRQEFETTDPREVEQFLEEMSFGYLGTVRSDGSPSITPLNYVFRNGNVYFHGSRAGEKMASLSGESRVTFAVAKEYAIIPSHFTDPLMACPATAFFKSVLIDGTAETVSDLNEKAEALEALMRKLQPEGGYKPIDAEDRDYIPRLKGVAVVKIVPTRVTGKFKFGQNKREDELREVMDGLSKRNAPMDDETRELMLRYCPHAAAMRSEGLGD